MASNTTQNVIQTTSNIGAAQLPYYNMAMQGAASLLNAPMARYDRDRLEGFTTQQKNLQNQIAGMQTPGQFGDASTLATAAGLGSLQAAQYAPGQFNAQQIGMPNLQQYSMQAPQQFGSIQAQQYMSPYAQSVMDVQKNEAIRDAQKGQIVQDLGAARQGTYGGSRQLLAGLERERNLGTQLGSIQAQGLQSAYENAQQQFERDRAAGINVGGQNLQAALGVQQLGTQSGLAALQSNQQADLDRQRMYEQSRQFGAGQQLQGLSQAGQMGQTLTNIGSAQQQADAQRLGLQTSTAAQEQALNQQMRDLDYADFQREADNPYTQLQRYMSLMSGVPQAMTSTRTESAPAPGVAQQLIGAGLGALGMYKTLGS